MQWRHSVLKVVAIDALQSYNNKNWVNNKKYKLTIQVFPISYNRVFATFKVRNKNI